MHNLTSNQEMGRQDCKEIPFYTHMIVKNRKPGYTKCWEGGGMMDLLYNTSLIHYILVQILWKMIKHYIVKLNILKFYELEILPLDVYPKETYKWLSTNMYKNV